MTRAVVTCFHNYVPMFDHKYFNVMSDYYMKNYKEFWKDEIDRLYILDSNWDFNYEDDKLEIVKTDPNMRYFDTYKWFLPKIKEDMVLFIDNDMVVYRKGIVDNTFKKLEEGYDVVSIYDTCGEFRFPQLNGQNKFCPYWFATKVDTLKKYKYVDWAPNMPKYETIGELTHEMLNRGLKPFEIEEDKTLLGKDLGYYHIRAGSVPAYLLTHKYFGNKRTYWDFIDNQPEDETLRHFSWYARMGGDKEAIRGVLADLCKEDLTL